MNGFRVAVLAALMGQAQVMLSTARTKIHLMKMGGSVPEEVHTQQAVKWVDNAKKLCSDIGLTESLLQIELAEHHLFENNLLTLHTFHDQINRIVETMIVELRKRRFLFVSADRTEFFEKEDGFGSAVLKRFPLAKDDIIEAGNCLCAECYTTSVFHLMKTFE